MAIWPTLFSPFARLLRDSETQASTKFPAIVTVQSSAAEREYQKKKSKNEWIPKFVASLSFVAAAASAVASSISAHNSSLSADIAEASLEPGQRAFISAPNLVIKKVKINGSIWWSFTTESENTGNTPPRNLSFVAVGTSIVRSFGAQNSIYSEMLRDEGPSNLTADPNVFFENASNVRTAVIAPHHKYAIGHFSLRENDLLDAMRSKWKVFVKGVLNYDDVFGKSHTTKYCFIVYLDTNEEENTPFQTQCQHWNCVDADCSKEPARYLGALFDEKRRRWQGMVARDSGTPYLLVQP